MTTVPAPVETPEQKATREAEARRLELEKQAREAAANKPQDTGIMGAIMGFLKFLFEIFFPNTEAPDEAPAQPSGPARPETPAQISRLGQLIIDAKAIPKWAEFQRQHKNSPVVFQSPVASDTQVTSGFGHRHHPIKGVPSVHAGVDLGARGGVANPDIVASEKGIILFAGEKQGYGQTVIVGHADGSYSLYGHMTGAKMPSVGAEVKQGQAIGVMGTTGMSTGVHLHFEQRKGTEALPPRLAGMEVKNGMMVAAAPSRPTTALAALVDPSKMPKLATQAGGNPQALAFAGGRGASSSHHQH